MCSEFPRIPTITSPYDDGIPGNPVGNLQELCISHRWAPPSYLLDGENGLPHEREFVITCIVENYTEIGAGKSKKLAKRQAAYRMLMRVKDTPIESANQGVGLEDEDEVSYLFFLYYNYIRRCYMISLLYTPQGVLLKFIKILLALLAFFKFYWNFLRFNHLVIQSRSCLRRWMKLLRINVLIKWNQQLGKIMKFCVCIKKDCR